MSSTAIAEAQDQALGIFADAVLKLALHIQREAMVAEDLDQAIRAAGAVHRLGRGLRQTVALQAKLARDARTEAVKAQAEVRPAPASKPEPAPLDAKTIAARRRRDWLTRGVERCVWNEYERDEDSGEFTGESLLEDFHERLADIMADPDAFLALDPDALVVQLCQELGLTPPKFHPPAPPVPPVGPPVGPPGTAALNGHDSS